MTTLPGELPTNAAKFAVLNPVDRYIELDQPGKQSIEMIRALYDVTPRTNYGARMWNYGPSGRGIDTPIESGPTTWITYTIRPSKFTSEAYSAAKTYKTGGLAYFTDGNVYRAISDVTGVSPDTTNNVYWALVPMPHVLSEYVKTAAASAAADDAQTQTTLLAQAKELLTREIDKLIEQGEGHNYRFADTSRTRIPYGVSGFWWSVRGT